MRVRRRVRRDGRACRPTNFPRSVLPIVSNVPPHPGGLIRSRIPLLGTSKVVNPAEDRSRLGFCPAMARSAFPVADLSDLCNWCWVSRFATVDAVRWMSLPYCSIFKFYRGIIISISSPSLPFCALGAAPQILAPAKYSRSITSFPPSSSVRLLSSTHLPSRSR